jgi:hypothetical protein
MTVWNGMELCFYSKLWKKMVLMNFKAVCLKWEIKIDNKANKVELSPIEVHKQIKKNCKNLCLCVLLYYFSMFFNYFKEILINVREIREREREEGIISEC